MNPFAFSRGINTLCYGQTPLWIEDIGPTQVVSVAKRADRGKKASMVENNCWSIAIYTRRLVSVLLLVKGHPRMSVSANVSCNAEIDIM